MKYKIGIFGSDSGSTEKTIKLAEKLGKVLGEYSNSVIILTGGGSGLPFAVTKEAVKNGVEAWAFTTEMDYESFQSTMPGVDLSIYKKIVYSPKDFIYADNLRARKKYRNVVSTATCDGGIVFAGQWGTLNEFTNLIDMQKTVGIWSGTGGISDELPKMLKKISKEGQGLTFIDDNPTELVKKLLESLKK